jgi:hypothetical protein
MRKVIFTLLTIFLFIGAVQAKYTQTCKVKYKKDYGWSNYYTVDVTFMSGTELNRATKTFNYDGYSTYAIIFWDKDEVTVIKISSYTGCGIEVNQSCITNKVTNLEGDDRQGRGWKVCTMNYCY